MLALLSFYTTRSPHYHAIREFRDSSYVRFKDRVSVRASVRPAGASDLQLHCVVEVFTVSCVNRGDPHTPYSSSDPV